MDATSTWWNWAVWYYIFDWIYSRQDNAMMKGAYKWLPQPQQP